MRTDTNMALTEFAIKSAKAGAKIVKLSDGGGLQLWITPDGAKRWRKAYRFNGAQKTLALGVYPDVGLRDARDASEAAKRLLALGVDPSHARKSERAAKVEASANTFATLAAELLDKKRRESKADRTLTKLEWFIALVSPSLGTRPIAEIKAPEILAVLRIIESRGRLETARRVRATISEVFRLAVQTGRAEADPTGALKGALASPVVSHRAAIIDPKELGGLLRAIATYKGAPETVMALEMAVLTFVRPGELRAAEWREFDLENAVWSIPSERMKMGRPHKVPLAPRALAVLAQLRTITGGGKYLFPSVRSPSRCMSENTINAALRRLGFTKEEMTGHGFRSAASSLLNESGLWNPDAIERQLAHVDGDSVRRAYARAEFWDERVKMMGWWSDRCAEMRSGGQIDSLVRAG
jgi:integrase